MGQAQVVSRANELIDRLNAIRAAKEIDTTSLAQIAFAARGLKNADVSAYLGVQSMILALENNLDGVRSVAGELVDKFPFAFHDQLNVIRSFMVLNDFNSVESYALGMLDRDTERLNPDMVGSIANALQAVGAFEKVNELLDECGDLPANSATWRLLQTGVLQDRLLTLDVTGEEFRAFLIAVTEEFNSLGWKFPGFGIDPPFDLDEQYPAGLVKFFLSAPSEDLFDLEEKVMDGLIQRQEPLFGRGVLALSVEQQRR